MNLATGTEEAANQIILLNNFDPKENWYRLVRKKSHQQVTHRSVCYSTSG